MVTVKREYAADDERTLLVALVTQDVFLERVYSHLKGESKPFRSRWSNLVAGWCFAHFKEYHKAPKKAMKHLFRDFAARSKDAELIEVLEQFLEGLSRGSAHVKDMNEQFLVDLASRHFRQIKLERTVQEVEASLERKDLDAAEASLTGYSGIAFSSTDWIDPTDPHTVIESLRIEENNTLIRFRGDLDTFLAPFFERDGFISFVGPEKRGKSFFLMEVAWQAMIQRRRVLYYVVGDMSQPQVLRRLVTRAVRRPLHSGKIIYPVKLEKSGKHEVSLETDFRKYTEPLTLTRAVKAMKDLLEKTGSNSSRLKLKCCGGSSLTASDIERDVQMFARQGWVADVVVLDYADLLAPETSSKNQEYRHQVNETWKVMRRVASDHHLLLVTATQAAATSYGNSVIKKSDFSEDKRKNAHVTGMLGINQTSEEKAQGIYRLNWVFLRDGKWTDTQVVWTAGNLALACPCIVSLL